MFIVTNLSAEWDHVLFKGRCSERETDMVDHSGPAGLLHTLAWFRFEHLLIASYLFSIFLEACNFTFRSVLTYLIQFE